jgi:hypothetical protein
MIDYSDLYDPASIDEGKPTIERTRRGYRCIKHLCRTWMSLLQETAVVRGEREVVYHGCCPDCVSDSLPSRDRMTLEKLI